MPGRDNKRFQFMVMEGYDSLRKPLFCDLISIWSKLLWKRLGSTSKPSEGQKDVRQMRRIGTAPDSKEAQGVGTEDVRWS